MRKSRARLGVFAAVACLSTSPLWADPISFGFTVRVEQSQGPVEEVIGTPVRVGDIVTGTITLDGSFQDSSSALFGSYTSTGAPFGIRLSLDGNPGFDEVLTQILVGDAESSATHLMFLAYGARNGYDAVFQLTLRQPEPGTLTTAFPRQAPRLDLFRETLFRFSAVPLGVDDQDLTEDQVRRFSGPVTSLTDVAPVPEPGTLLLVGSGIAAALRIRRRRSAIVPSLESGTRILAKCAGELSSAKPNRG